MSTNLQRFVDAQEPVYAEALNQLRAGRKTSHWIWYVFPQLAGLGRSPTAQHFAITSLEEARAYLEHPLLGGRLRECARVVTESGAPSAEAIFGAVDAMKLRSSMTLFRLAAPGEPVFSAVLERYFGGEQDPLTEELLRGG